MAGRGRGRDHTPAGGWPIRYVDINGLIQNKRGFTAIIVKKSAALNFGYLMQKPLDKYGVYNILICTI